MDLEKRADKLSEKINESLKGKFIHQFRKGKLKIQTEALIQDLVYEELDSVMLITVKDCGIKCREQRVEDRKGMIETPKGNLKNRFKFLILGKF